MQKNTGPKMARIFFSNDRKARKAFLKWPKTDRDQFEMTDNRPNTKFLGPAQHY